MSSILESIEYRKKLFFVMSGMLLWEPIVGDGGGGQIQSCLLTLRWLAA